MRLRSETKFLQMLCRSAAALQRSHAISWVFCTIWPSFSESASIVLASFFNRSFANRGGLHLTAKFLLRGPSDSQDILIFAGKRMGGSGGVYTTRMGKSVRGLFFYVFLRHIKP